MRIEGTNGPARTSVGGRTRRGRRWAARAAAGALVLSILPMSPLPARSDPVGAKILFGVTPGTRGGQTAQQVLTSLETQAGHRFAGVREFDLWDTPFPTDYDNWLRDTGHTLFLSVKAKRMNGTVVLWRDIANAAPGSALYNDIARWANAIKNYGVPINFTFNHEPEASTNDANGTNTDFIAAWRNVITIFRNLGVTNAKFVWISTDFAFWRTDKRRADLWYPGDAYVDAAAADAYNWYNCRTGINTPWRTLEWIANYLRLWGQNHPQLELMLTEWASHEDPATPGRKANWINEAQALFKKPGWEQFTTVLYFHNSNRSTCNFWLDSSQSAMNAWLTMSNDPFYGRTTSSSTDTQAPTVPGQPSGSSQSAGAISLSWAASSDDQATSLLYRVYRDGGSTPVGSVTSSSTTTVSFTDTGLPGGTTHTYEVTASDGVNTSARSPKSAPITVMGAPVIFADGFDGGFGQWSGVTGLTLDQSTGAPAAPSARMQTSASKAFAYRLLGANYSSVCASMRVNLASTTDGAGLLRLRTAADGAIVRVVLTSSRVLGLRNDVSGTQNLSAVKLPLGTWTQLRLCGSSGTSGSWTLSMNGSAILGPWTIDTGSATVGRITVGTQDARTITANIDDVVVQTP
jgi:hypothetical protein